MNKKNYLLAALASLAFASCGEKDFYNPDGVQALQTAEFESNFIKEFGKPAADKNWDMSIAGSRYAATRAEGGITPVVDDEWYYVEQASLDFFQEELKEGENNRAKGQPFIMSAPNNGFAIYPIYQGAAAFKWDLHMVVEQSGVEIADINVWQKHRDIECQLSDETLEFDHTPSHKLSELDDKKMNFANMWLTGNGNEGDKAKFKAAFPESMLDADHFRKGDVWYTPQQAFGLHDSYTEYLGGATWAPSETGKNGWWENYEVGYNTTLAKAIRTKGIHFPTLPVGANIYFYLDVKNEVDGNWVDKKKESSLAHMMVALECEAPTNLPNHEITIIGCEDQSDETSDWDMNDLVFMVVGDPIVPKPIEIKENQYEEITVAKRYMIEDLGSTDDFDFNDIVLDVEEYCTHTITMTNGVKTADVAGDKHQRAYIRHLGGTLKWNLSIGNYQTGLRGGQMNVDPDELIELPDGTWNPETNNITVNVPHSGSNEVVYTITFPETGTIPMIIAVDPSQPWMEERKHIPAEWVK